jgi:hypothetical protein
MSELPKVKLGRKTYYFDGRLKQIRNVKNPHDFIDLTEQESKDYMDAIQAQKILEARAH